MHSGLLKDLPILVTVCQYTKKYLLKCTDWAVWLLSCLFDVHRYSFYIPYHVVLYTKQDSVVMDMEGIVFETGGHSMHQQLNSLSLLHA